MLKVTEKNKSEIKTFFENYPFKSFQRSFQKIDKHKLSHFLWNNFSKSLTNENCESYYIPTKALLTIARDKWHSSVYDMPMAKLNNLMLFNNSEDVLSGISETICEFQNKHNIKHIACRIDSSDLESFHFLSQKGFYFVGENIKMCLKVTDSLPEQDNPLEMVKYMPEHLDEIKRIAQTAHSKNYYFYDPNLDKTKTSAMFETWTQRCVDSLAENIWIAKKDGQVVGFLICIVPKTFNKNLNKKIAVLDFMAIDENYKGMKIGSSLMTHFINTSLNEFEMIELRTMSNNYPAICLYEKFGFRLISSDFVLHKFVE